MATGWFSPTYTRIPPQQQQQQQQQQYQQQQFASPFGYSPYGGQQQQYANSNAGYNNQHQQDTNDEDDELVNAIEKILSAEGNRRSLAMSTSACMQPSTQRTLQAAANVGPFLEGELKLLSLLCTQVSKRRYKQQSISNQQQKRVEGFAAVEVDLLTSITELLEKHVNLAVNVDLVMEASSVVSKREMKMDQWLRPGCPGNDRVAALQLGLEAASILLFIVTSPDIDVTVVSEDAIEACFTLLRHNLAKNLIPALNNTGHRQAAQEVDREKGLAAGGNSSSARKRKRRATDGGESNLLIRELRKVYKPIATMIPLQITLMSRIEEAIRTICRDDQLILTLTTGALDALEIEAAQSTQNLANRLQHATIQLVTAVFKKFPDHRSSIIEDLCPLMLRLPSSKRSMRACHVQYSSCPAKYSSQSLMTSLYSNMLTNGPEPHYIQMITAMLLSLVQCCVKKPTYHVVNDDDDEEYDDDNNNNNNQGQEILLSGLRNCQLVADKFAIQMQERCSRKGEDGGASEFRPILGNLIEDLLLVMMIPEYAGGAQMVLYSCTRFLSEDVIRASRTSAASETVIETTYANTAFDILGRICAAYAKILAFQRDRELHKTVEIVPEDERRLRCYCKRNSFTDALMVDCDNCHVWYHAQCVGLNRDALPQEWICDACSLQANVEHEMETTSRRVVDTGFIINRVMEKHLKSTRGYRVASHCHLARWVNELHGKSLQCETAAAKESYKQAIGGILETWNKSRSFSSPKHGFTYEGGARALLAQTASYSGFMKSFNNLMGLMLKLMSDKSHASLRKLSIKAIEKVVEADSKLMLLNKVMDAVSERLSDEAISVREAVVSLVGNYVVASPAIANAFHSHLIPRLLDPGVSVRKRTVKILQDILVSNPHYRGRSDACDKCLQRASDPKEDEGVREALHSLFMTLWLSEEGESSIPAGLQPVTPSRSGLNFAQSKSPGSNEGQSVASGVVTPTPPTDARATRSKHREVGKLRSELAAEQMVATVKTAGTNEHLGNFLRELLCNVNDSDKGKKAAERLKRQKAAEAQCSSLVAALFELLLTTEEKREELGDQLGGELVATVRTIGCFAEVATKSVLKHLDTILPYLKADNGLPTKDESALASAASDILFRVTPILNSQEIQNLSSGSLGGDLVKITYKFGSGALFSAVRSLCTIAHLEETGEESVFGKKVITLAKTFYAYLFKNVDQDDYSNPGAKNNTLRLLSGLGSLCRHHEVAVESSIWNEELEVEEVDDIELFEARELDWNNIPIACFRLFMNYLEKNDIGIRCAALRALSGVFIAHPRLMLACAQSGLIESLMSSASPLELQLTALTCWKEISVSEEKRIDSGEAKKKMDSKKTITTSKKISGDQDGDSTLVGGVLTKQTARLFEMTQAKEANLRIASLELLGQLLRQGLVNPNEAVPYLLALQGDVENFVVRKFALRLLTVEGEKRPDMLRQRVNAGIKQACRFQRQVYPTKETSALVKKLKGNRVDVECVFDDVFRDCIVSSRKQREGLYRNLLAMFERVEPVEDEPTSSAKKKPRSRKVSILEPPDASKDLSLLSFSAQVLAYLPYASQGDPLFIQHHIGNVVALQGPQLQDRLAAFLRPHGLASADELDEFNEGEDALERAALSEAPLKSEHAAPCNTDKFDWPAFADLCKEASSLALLLRLKKFLRRKYNLTTAKCLEYSPDSKDKTFFRNFISRNDHMALFDSSIVLVSSDFTDDDKETLIHHYAVFRRNMRDEFSTEEVDPDSDGEGRRSRRGSLANANGIATTAAAVAAAAIEPAATIEPHPPADAQGSAGPEAMQTEQTETGGNKKRRRSSAGQAGGNNKKRRKSNKGFI